jgi:outer membrane protein
MLKQFTLVILFIGSESILTTNALAEYKPQSLMDVYDQALAHDPQLASALSEKKAVQEIIEQGKALYRPVVYFNAGLNDMV